jgi:hypothetical protein
MDSPNTGYHFKKFIPFSRSKKDAADLCKTFDGFEYDTPKIGLS